MKKSYGRKVYIAMIITALIELAALFFFMSKVESVKTVLFCVVMAIGGGMLTLSDLSEEAGEEKMPVMQILTALLLLIAETYAAGMLIL